MSKDSSLVKRLIAFLKRPEALQYNAESKVVNPYDDYVADYVGQPAAAPAPVVEETAARAHPQYDVAAPQPVMYPSTSSAYGASRLDALIMRAVQQFHAQAGCVIRQSGDGRMTYCTGRDIQGRYIPHNELDVDRRALFMALDSGESQLFVHSNEMDTHGAVLCGPLWVDGRVIGVLYLDGPVRNRLHRGIFDLFCDQAARMLAEGVA